MTAARLRAAGILGREYRWVTVGTVALVFLAGVQSLAITTVMPVVADDLDGAPLFALAFSATLATSVIGMVVTGLWCDRSGPRAPLTTAVGVFVAGLLVAGFASEMWVLVVGRLVQGFGVGGQTVAVYVVVARAYPRALHGRVFSAFSAAWVVPSLVGPFLAGAVAEYLHWRWVFLGVAALTVLAYALVAVRLRAVDLTGGAPTPSRIAREERRQGVLRVTLATVVAATAVVLGLAGGFAAPWNAIAAAAALAVIGFAVRPLFPRGTLRAGRGLPSVVLTRGLAAAALFGGEVFLPRLLRAEYGFSPTFSGLALTTGVLAWAVGTELSGRHADRLGSARVMSIGAGLLAASIAAVAVAVAVGLPAWAVIAAWTVAGGGMGLLYPRLTVLTLAYSITRDQGFNSSALSISDSLTTASAVAVMGVAFTAAGGDAGHGAGYVIVLAVATTLAAAALLPGSRVGNGPAERADAAA